MDKKQIFTVVGVGIAGIVIWKILQKKKSNDATRVAQASTAAPSTIAAPSMSEAEMKSLITYIGDQVQAQINSLQQPLDPPKNAQGIAILAKDNTPVIRCKQRLLNTVRSGMMTGEELKALSTYFLYLENKYVGTKHHDDIEGEAGLVAAKYQAACVWADEQLPPLMDAIQPVVAGVPVRPPVKRSIFGFRVPA